MPFDFTASELVVVQEELNQVFTSGRTTLERSTPPETAKRLLAEQTAEVNKIMNNGVCVAHEVVYLFSDNVTVPTVTTSAPAANCDIPLGDGSSSAKKVYNPNMYLKEVIEVRDKDCDNVFKFAQKVAHLLASKMALMSQAINEHLIAQLVLLKQTPTFVGDGTLNVDIIEYPAASFTPDLLADWDLVARNNDLASDYLILNGTNFRNLTYNANFKQLNDDQRSDIAQLTNGNKMSWDIKQLDQVVTTPTSFLVDRHMTAFFNRSTYPDDLEPVGDNQNTAIFRLPLQYFANNADPDRQQQTLQYMDGGEMKDVMIDIRYQRLCNAAETDGGRVSTTHRWELLCECGFDIAPATSGTGIIQIDKV